MSDKTEAPEAGAAEGDNTDGDQSVANLEPAEVIEPKTESVIDVPTDLGDDEEDHQSWGSKLSYILTLVGYAVGFGNLWRFPFLLQSNGGVAFLVPYTCMLALLGIPGFFLELAIGQRLRKGTLGCWNEISPYLGGIGVTAGITCLLTGLYYTALIGYCLYYLIDSFRPTLRWEDCDHAVANEPGTCEKAMQDMQNGITSDVRTTANFTHFEACQLCEIGDASQFYWNHEVLDISPGIDDVGRWNWYIAGYVVLAWLLIWLILVKGIKATGKIVYFTALFPYIVLVIFLIFALTLPGMEQGYRVLFTPDWSKLLEGPVWMVAGTQIFFSLGLGFGSLIVFASYLPSNNDCYTDAVRVSLINCGTSLFAATVIFPILGFSGTVKFDECTAARRRKLIMFANNKSHGLNESSHLEFKPVGKLDAYENIILNTTGHEVDRHTICLNDSLPNFANAIGCSDMNNSCTRDCDLDTFVKASGSGPSLVFIAFAEAITKLPAPQFWSFLFFTMLLTLGIDSGFGTVEGGIAVVLDLFNSKRHGLVTSVYCAVSCVVSMLFCLGWGQYLISLVDTFAVNWCLLIIVFFECIGVAYIYGLKQFSYDIKLMTGRRPNVYLLMCWKIFSPIVMFVLFIVSVIQFFLEGIQYSVWDTARSTTVDRPWPVGAVVVGFILTVLAVIWIPLFAILNKFNISLLRKEVPAFFPEGELRDIRNITSDEEEEQTHTPMEKALYWGQTRTTSQAVLVPQAASVESANDQQSPTTAATEIEE